jgi:anti-sigma factor RsiW
LNCPKAHKLIALDVEGDLADRETPGLRDHLAACPACVEFAQEMRESQWAFKSLGESGPENAVLLRARQTALEQIRFEQSSSGPAWWTWIARPQWVYANAGLAVLVCLAAGWLALREPRNSVVVAESPAAQTERAAARDKELPGRAAPVTATHDANTATTEIPSSPKTAERNNPAERAEPAMASLSREPVERVDEAPLAPRIEVVSVNADAASAEDGSETVLLNIASSDPNVLLYWVMDDQGGS